MKTWGLKNVSEAFYSNRGRVAKELTGLLVNNATFHVQNHHESVQVKHGMSTAM